MKIDLEDNRNMIFDKILSFKKKGYIKLKSLII